MTASPGTDWGPSAEDPLVNLGNASDHTGCAFLCPTVTEYPDAWPLWILVGLYVVNGLASIAVLVRKKQGKSWFRNLFLYLQFLLCLLRALTFVVRIPHEDTQTWLLLFVAYTLPIFIQFVTFSLLTVFLIKCLLTIQEKAHLVNTVLYPIYTGVIFALAGASGVSTYLASRADSSSAPTASDRKPSGIDQGLTYYSGITFGLLTICVGITGYKTHSMLLRIVLSEARQRQVKGVSYVVAMYCVVFTGRTAWSISYMLDENILQTQLNEYEDRGETMPFYIGTMLFYISFEILPTIYLLRCFWVWLRPSTSHRLVHAGSPLLAN